MSSLAMADLLKYYLATGDKRLVAIETVGEKVVKPSKRYECVVWCSVVRSGDVCDAPSVSLRVPVGIMTQSMKKKGEPFD